MEEFFHFYFFARFDLPRYYHMIKYTRGIRRIVGDTIGNPTVVGDNLIDTMRSRTRDGYITVEPYQLAIGDNVIIKGGPLDGFTGLFMGEVKPRDRVLVLLNTISYQAKVEVYSDFVVKACSVMDN